MSNSTHTNKTTSKARAARQELGLSLDEVGRRAGIERSRLSRFERGYLVLRDEELARLARVLGVRALPAWVRASPRQART